MLNRLDGWLLIRRVQIGAGCRDKIWLFFARCRMLSQVSIEAPVVMMNQKRDAALNAYGSLESNSNELQSEICFPALHNKKYIFKEIYQTAVGLEF